MKKILLTAIFVSVFSGVGATAQTVFIPQPPVVNIPLLDPSRMIIQNEVNRNTINGAEERGGTKGTKPRPPPTPGVVDYTMFNAWQENYMPKVMAQSVKGSVAEQRQAEQFYNAQIELYENTAEVHNFPANDLAFAFLYFIANNYEIYYDLLTMPKEKDPWAKRAKNQTQEIALMKEKNSRKITPEQDRTVYSQIKNMLAAKPEIKKMTDQQKQEMTETLAIVLGMNYAGYMKAIDDEDERAIAESHEAAKKNLEGLLSVPIGKIKFSADGLHLE